MSMSYISQKKKFAQQVGISFELFQFSANITESELVKEIQSLNRDSDIS